VDEQAGRGISAPLWWQNTTGQRLRTRLRAMVGVPRIRLLCDLCHRRQSVTSRTASANNRNHFDYGYMLTGIPGEEVRGQKPRSPAVAAMLQPHTPNMTWQYLDWLKGSCSLPIVIKGILTQGCSSGC